MPAQATRSGCKNLEEALAYARLGLRVLPLHHVHDGSCSCGKPDCKQAGKHPQGALVPNGSLDATTDENTIRGWWKQHPQANVGIATGEEAGLFVIGPDGPAGIEALANLEQLHGPLPPTPTSNTGSGGQHRLFRWPAVGGIKNRRNHLDLPIDVRGTNGLIVAPPSCNAKGPYIWVIAPGEAPIAEAPAWLLEWCRREKERPAPTPSVSRPVNGSSDPGKVIERAVAYLAKCAPAVSGQGGHDTTFAAARAVVWGFGLGAETGFQLLSQHYNPTCQPPWAEHELRHKCEQADVVPFDKPRGYLLAEDRLPRPLNNGHTAMRTASEGGNGSHVPSEAEAPPDEDECPKAHLTDRGNAIRLAQEHGPDLRHIAGWRKWLVWDGARWRLDDTLATTQRAKQTIARLFAESLERIQAIRKELDALKEKGE